MRIRDDYNSKAKTREELVEERRKMKPETGNLVDYLGERFIIAEVGSRYVRMYKEGGDKRAITVARVDMVKKLAE